MTDPRTIPQKCEAIAIRRGWKVHCGKWQHPIFQGFAYKLDNPPDYFHKWDDAGPLLEELLEWHGRIEFGQEFFMVHMANHKPQKSDTLSGAIANAWLAWQEGEE